MKNTFKNILKKLYLNEDMIYIILIFFVIFDICRHKNVEKMENDMTNKYIKEAITKTYKFDVESIKNLVEIANNFYKDDYLELPGNVKINGTLNYLPKGCIMPYNPPDLNNITAPEGWAICDGGSNDQTKHIIGDIPDLRGRFIIGYGNGYNVGSTGGAASVALNHTHNPTHNHGSHKHNHKYHRRGKDDLNWKDNTSDLHRNIFSKNNLFSNKRFGMRWWRSHDTHNNPGDHYHAYNGANHAHENRPPYYTLVYIIKL